MCIEGYFSEIIPRIKIIEENVMDFLSFIIAKLLLQG